MGMERDRVIDERGRRGDRGRTGGRKARGKRAEMERGRERKAGNLDPYTITENRWGRGLGGDYPGL